MHDFLILYAPPLVVAASVIGVFIWGTKGSYFEQKDVT